MTRTKTRVVIVDDSMLARAVLRDVLEEDGDIEIVGEAQNANEALQAALALQPDLVTMDIDMPGASGLEAIDWLMEKSPVPILVITSERLDGDAELGFQAISRGALDFRQKPSITAVEANAELRALVRTLAHVPVFAHVGPSDEPKPPPPSSAHGRSAPIELVALTAGIGGPRAVAAVIERLGTTLPCAVVLFQQMPTSFAPGFVRFLASLTPLPLHLVEAGTRTLHPGAIYVVAGRAQVRCASPTELRFERSATPPRADVLLSDISHAYGARAIGVVLSGTGQDGADGLRAMREAGAVTIVERPQTAVPNEMPAHAITVGGAHRLMSAELIADYIVSRVTTERIRTTAPPSA